jgi:hypothetical protein
MSSFIKATENLQRFMREHYDMTVSGYFVLQTSEDVPRIEDLAKTNFIGKYMVLSEMIILEKEDDAIPVMLCGVPFVT